MNKSCDCELADTKNEVWQLRRKLRDVKFLLDSIADSIQYEFGFDNEAYKKCKRATNDDTLWDI